jgi:hypothetical protein
MAMAMYAHAQAAGWYSQHVMGTPCILSMEKAT